MVEHLVGMTAGSLVGPKVVQKADLTAELLGMQKAELWAVATVDSLVDWMAGQWADWKVVHLVSSLAALMAALMVGLMAAMTVVLLVES